MKNAPITVFGFSGEQHSANSAKEIVEQLRAASWGGENSDGIRVYMRQIAKRVLDWSGSTIRTHKPLAFLLDLEEAGLIRVIIDGEKKSG